MKFGPKCNIEIILDLPSLKDQTNKCGQVKTKMKNTVVSIPWSSLIQGLNFNWYHDYA